jgi:hypothetical protein
MRQVDLEPGQWARTGARVQPPPAPPKYPRKILGLTDYGPTPISWGMVVSLTVFWSLLYAARHFW